MRAISITSSIRAVPSAYACTTLSVRVSLVVETVEMAYRGVQVHRLHRIPARHVDAVEILGELQESRDSSPGRRRAVRGRGRSSSGGLDTLRNTMWRPPMVTARSGLRGRDGELRGREPHLLHHELPIHAHVGAAGARLAAGRLEDRSRLLVQELDPDLLEHPHRAVVHRPHLLGGERLGGDVVVDGGISHGSCLTAGPRAAAVGASSPGSAHAPALGGSLFHSSLVCMLRTPEPSRHGSGSGPPHGSVGVRRHRSAPPPHHGAPDGDSGKADRHRVDMLGTVPTASSDDPNPLGRPLLATVRKRLRRLRIRPVPAARIVVGAGVRIHGDIAVPARPDDRDRRTGVLGGAVHHGDDQATVRPASVRGSKGAPRRAGRFRRHRDCPDHVRRA